MMHDAMTHGAGNGMQDPHLLHLLIQVHRRRCHPCEPASAGGFSSRGLYPGAG